MVRIGSADDLGAYIRDQRNRAQLSQADLARRAGVSRRWLVSLEQAKATAELGLILCTLDALGVVLDAREDADRGAELDDVIRRHTDEPHDGSS